MSDRATIFGEYAATYDDVRPRYPDAVIDLVVEGDPQLAIDVGCGTGIASCQVAERGVRVVGVEPDLRMAAFAKTRGVEVDVSSLEAWTPRTCDVMFAAQSWHWIDPVVGATVASRAIRAGGRWVALWNVESDPDIERTCAAVYRRLAPSLLPLRRASRDEADFDRAVEAGLSATGAFEGVTTAQVEWTEHIESDRFVDRLGSHSSHRLLPERTQARVREALLTALGGEAHLEIRYTTEVLVAHRRS